MVERKQIYLYHFSKTDIRNNDFKPYTNILIPEASRNDMSIMEWRYNHKWYFNTIQGMDIYFAHPYSPWERGANVRISKRLIRR
jgi:hypothetical protein